jgi:hypothetical protein
VVLIVAYVKTETDVYRIAVYSRLMDSAREITVLQLPKFKTDATELIGADGIEAIYLIDHPEAGNVIPASGGLRKLRWAAKGKGKRGGARIIYIYVATATYTLLVPHAFTCSPVMPRMLKRI